MCGCTEYYDSSSIGSIGMIEDAMSAGVPLAEVLTDVDIIIDMLEITAGNLAGAFAEKKVEEFLTVNADGTAKEGFLAENAKVRHGLTTLGGIALAITGAYYGQKAVLSAGTSMAAAGAFRLYGDFSEPQTSSGIGVNGTMRVDNRPHARSGQMLTPMAERPVVVPELAPVQEVKVYF